MLKKGSALCRRPLDTGGSCLWETEWPTEAGAGAQSGFVACFFVLFHGNRTSKMYACKGSFEVKLLTRGTDGKAEMGRVREEQRRSKKIREEKGSEERRCRWRKGRKVAKHCVWTMIYGKRHFLNWKQPAAHSAKQHFLNWLETSFKPSICLASCTASSQLACVLLQLSCVQHSSGQRTPPQG